MIIEKSIRTLGDLSEDVGLILLDGIVERSEAFSVYREVEGEYHHPRADTGDHDARIDRVLVPKPKIIELGWKRGGAIGIEGKASGKKIGPLIVQAMDYSRCVFKLQNKIGLFAMVSLKWIFIYPVLPEQVKNDLESVTANHRIGLCSITQDNCLNFYCGGMCGIRIRRDGTIEIARDFPMGNKRGSR